MFGYILLVLYLSLLKRIIIIITFYLVVFASYNLNERSVTMDFIEGNW